VVRKKYGSKIWSNKISEKMGGPKVRDHWEDLGIGGRITLS
jgi:hypothetical protein